MPCKIEITKKIEDLVEQLTESVKGSSLRLANEKAKEVNDSFGAKVVQFDANESGLERSIFIPGSLIQIYYDNELEMEKQEAARLLKEEEEKERKYVESKKEEWEENREYFESDEPFTRVSDVNTQIQKKLQELYPEINLNITNKPVWEQGNDILNQEEYDKEVAYRLKAVEILLSDKAKQIFEKGNKNNWDLDKILTELDVPKDQKQLILNLGKTNIEEIITDLLANYSYTVKINTAKDNIAQTSSRRDELQFTVGDNYYTSFDSLTSDEKIYKKDDNKITKKEYDNARELHIKEYDKTLISRPTQHYSNLTVPGGTNYTENEIATPAITPSIKGHAQFATDQGIGWFRSDDRQVNLGGAELSEEYKPDIEQLPNGKWEVSYLPITGGRKLEFFKTEQEAKDFVKDITKTSDEKTRRILEVQSDYFQKLRKKFTFNNIIYRLDDRSKQGTSYYKNGVDITKQEYNKAFEDFIYEGGDNQFLALLHKGDNWVTFFVKSIIQDSAKKGYEKVLFPSGNTASKVEGHTTLEEFKKQKEDRIKEINKLKANSLSYKEIQEKGKYLQDKFGFKSIEEQEGIDNSKEEDYNNQIIDRNNKFDNEINQLKQELETVEKEGFGALKPIFNFYENTVTNILNKQYGKENVNQVTDEYGNTWNEITINQARELQNVLLQKNEANRIIGQANIKAMSVLVDAVNKKEDTLPHEYAHHYIAWFRNTPIVQEAIKKWGSEEALVQSIGEQVVKQKGEAYDWWKKFTDYIMDLFNNLSTKDKQELTNILTDAFLSGIDLENNNVGISRERSKELASKASGIFNQEEPIKPGVEELFDSNPELANQVYEALGFKTKSLNTLNDLPTLIKNLKEAGFNVNERQSIENSVKTLKQGLDVILLEDGLQGGRLSYNEDTETLDLWFTNGLEKQDNNLRLKAEKIFNGQITPQQKQQALQLYSQYLQQNPNGSVEQFKNWVEEFNRKLHPLTIEEFSKLQREVHSKITESKFKKYKNVKELLNDIINSNKEDSYNSILAKFLLNVKGVNDSFLELNKDFKKDYYGDYSGLDRKIRLSKELNSNKSLFEITALHEILHSITVNVYDQQKLFKKEIDDIFNYVVNYEPALDPRYVDKEGNILDIVGYGKALDFSKQYGMKNPYEFMAESFTNDEFIKFLEGIPAEKEISLNSKKISKINIYQKFIQAIIDFLNKYEFYNTKNKTFNTQSVAEAVRISVLNNAKQIRGYENKILPIESLSDFISQKSQERLNAIQDIFNQNPELSKIGDVFSYASYLDTIFPDSQVKDIVYHGTDKTFESFSKNIEKIADREIPNNATAYFFTNNLDRIKDYGRNKINAILNTKEVLDFKNISIDRARVLSDITYERAKQYTDRNIDSVIADYDLYKDYIVFEPEQIHILGSKQDIEGFKEFVGESTQTVESYRAQEQAELSQRIPNIEDYKVNGKVDKSLITDENDLETYNEIYDKYDALITPLLEASEESEENTDNLEELLDNEKLDFQDAILIDLINKVAPNQESLPTTEEVVEELPSQQSIDSQKQNDSYSDLVSTIKGLMNTLGIKIVKAEAIYLKQQEINTLYDKLASSKSDIEKQSIQKQIDELKREGVRKNVLGLADTLNGVINLALSENNIDESEFALNEEMLHFIVDIIEQKYPDLYKELLQKVGTYNLYNQMYDVYASQKEYQNEDGSVNVNKIKKEAVAKVLNDFLSNPEYSEEDYQLSKTQNLWNKIKNTLKSFFEEKSNNIAANNFRFTLDKLLNDPNFITKEDAKLLSGEEFFGIMGTISSWKGNKMMGKESAFNTKKFVSSADFVKDILEQKNNVSKTYVDKNTGKLSSPSDPNSTERYAVKTPTGIVIVRSRVSDFVAKFLEKIFPNSSSKNNKELELAAERGVIIHNIFELTFAKYVDPATGIVRKQPINSSPQLETYEKKYAKDGELSMTEKADKYVKELIALNPNSYFLTEIPIFNKSLTVGGTIDLMIIDANKKVHIYDWKTKKADVHKGQGIIQKREKIDPWNIKAWRIQLDSYMDILKNNYGVESFGKVRMIPIMTEFETNGTTISNINVGSEKSPDIRQRQLLAVPSKQELTGLSETDKLIKANYGLAEKLQNKANKVSDITEKEKLRLQSSVLEDLAIDLQVGKGIQSLVNKLEQILKIHDDIIEKDRNGEIKGSDLPIIASAIVDLSIYASDNRLANVAGELFSRFENLTDLQKETKKELESLSVQVSNKVAELKKVLINSAEVLGNDQGIYEVGKIENEIENSPGIISFSKIRAQRNSIYQLNFKTGQLFGNLVRGIQNNVERQRSDVRNTLEKIKVDYLKDFGGIFKSDESVFSILFRYPTPEEIKNGAIDGPKLVAKIDKKFYASLKEQKEKFVNLVNASIKTKKDFTKTAGYTELVKWLESNIDLEAWRKNYIERKEKQKNLLKTQYSYIADDYERDYAIEQALTSWEYRYNILKSPAALNSNNVSAFINEDKWLSADYKKIKSSPSALATYNAFREIMFNARRVGYIQDLSQISEIPTNITTKNKLAYYYSLVKLHGSLKYLYFNSIPKVLEDMLLKPLESNLALDDIKNGFSNINPITQEEELELPIYMLRDFNAQVSKDGKLKSLKDLDLFKVYEELAFHVINFENLSATEELADAIIMVEESKTLEKQMNAQGNTNENKVKAKEIKTREEILKHAKNFIYYNKTKEKDKTTVFNFSVNKLVEYTKSYAAALYLGANHALAFKAFTASTLSAFSNAGDIYSKRDVLFSPLRRIVSSGLIEKSFNYHVSSSNLHENRLKNNNYAKKAAVYGKEYLFNSLTVVDYEIQKNLFFAALPNFTIIEENGVKKIVNIDKYVDDKYPNIFEETPEKRKEIFKKKDEEKEKLRKNSLVEQLQERAKKIKAGDMSIDLSDIDTESIDKFTNKVQEGAKRVLGNMSDKDIYLWKTGNLPSLLTQFKGFAFKIFDVRWGGIKYNAALERYTYGKMSALSNFLLTKEQVIDENNQEILKTKFTFLSTIIRFLQISAPFLNVKKNEQVIQILKIKYLQYATDAKNKNQTVMSEREYMEMYLAELTSAKNELYILVVFAGLFAFAAGGDDDDDDPWLKYLKNIIRGVTKELLFPYSPNQLSSMVVLSFPGLGALTALFNAFSFQFGNIIEFTKDSPAYVKVDPFRYTVGERLSPVIKATPYVRPISALLAEYNADWRKFLDVDKKSRSLVKNRLK